MKLSAGAAAFAPSVFPFGPANQLPIVQNQPVSSVYEMRLCSHTAKGEISKETHLFVEVF